MRNPLDISPAKKELGWAPKIYLQEGIARLTAWLQEHKAQMKL
jgi:nucleoside-diphosphate-sugar epimerase